MHYIHPCETLCKTGTAGSGACWSNAQVNGRSQLADSGDAAKCAKWHLKLTSTARGMDPSKLDDFEWCNLLLLRANAYIDILRANPPSSKGVYSGSKEAKCWGKIELHRHVHACVAKDRCDTWAVAARRNTGSRA